MAEEGGSKKDESKKGDHPKDESKKGESKKDHKGESKKDEPKKDGEHKKGVSRKEESKKDENFKYIIRLVNTDIDGNKPIVIGLQSVKGVGSRVAEIIVKRASVDRVAKVGTLSDEKVDELEKLITSYAEYAPAWAVNRQLDFETGDDMHTVGVDLEIFRKDDINRMKMIRSYKGVRHEEGQKVRGQRTRSNGRTGLTLGVIRARLAQPGAAPAEGGEKKEKPAAAGAAKTAAAAVPATAAAAPAKPATPAKPAKPEAKK